MATAHADADPSSNASTCLGRHWSATHPSQSASHGSVHSHLPGDVHASVGASDTEKKDLVPPLVPNLPCCSVVIGASGTVVSTKTGVRDGSVLMDQRGLQWVNEHLPWLHGRNWEERIWNSEHPAAVNMFQSATDSLELSGMTTHQTRHSGASIDPVGGFRTLQEVQKPGQWRVFSSVARYGQSSRLAADYHSLPRPLRDKREALALRVEVLSTRHEVWSQDVSDEKWSQERFHLHDNTLLAPPNLFRQCCHRKLASSWSHAWALADLFFFFFANEHVDSRESHRIARKVFWNRWPLLCFRTKNMFIQRLTLHDLSVVLHVATPALTVSPWTQDDSRGHIF